ncbi:AAA family ATPase [Paenibacillus oryzisoli]|uniref:AAA family ATPase n=1 Tax=Paenibacillus oryzisoli TaxID=1850517 RepID=UPI003D27D21E
MDKKKGITLQERMQEGRVSLPTFFTIAFDLAALIRKRHESGYIGHDLQPDQLWINRDAEYRLPQDTAGILGGRMTAQGKHLQTEVNRKFIYMSPEQTGRLNRQVDERSDLYVLGLLWYELLTGELPFKAATASDWIHAHLALLPVPPSTVDAAIPQTVSDLVLKLLAKAPEDRYQSINGLCEDVERMVTQLNERGTIEPFLLGETDAISRFRLPDKLYGREAELQVLHERYDSARKGAMELVLVSGHAGSGKTSLVKAFQSAILNQRSYVISGKFDQLNQATPYASLIAAFRDLIRQLLSESEEQIAAWKRKIQKALGPNAQVMTEVIAELSLIIGEQPPIEELPPSGATHRFQSQFSSFVKVFADRSHPLVLWLDNLHWADAASLNLLRALASDAGNKYLCIIGTQRCQETGGGTEFLPGASLPTAANVTRLELQALGYPHVQRYTADVLQREAGGIKPLSDALYRKTAGNPFYIKQMLQTWVDERLLYFNWEKRSWAWDLQGIQAWEGFSDVLGLIVGRFNALPAATRHVLRLASCIGNVFSTEQLAMLQEQEIAQTEKALLPAVNEGLVLVERDTYMFLHDQVQQAAYELMPEEEKRQVHLKIGRQLLRHYRTETTERYLFDVVHHMNWGRSLLTDPAEMEQLARLNLLAGKKAKASAAYAQANQLLKHGLALVSEEGWSGHAALYASLLLESSECQYFCGEFEEAEAVLEHLLLHVDGLAIRAKIYVVQIMMYASQKREETACRIALKALAEFGLHVPYHPSRIVIAKEIFYTQAWLAGKMKRLRELQVSPDPGHTALADIVMASSSILFIVNEKAAAVLLAKYVRMSLQQGSSEALSIALGSYAMTLCYGAKRPKSALSLAELALQYAEKLGSLKLKGKIECMVGLLLQEVKPEAAGAHFARGADYSLTTGDLVYAGYSISSHVITENYDLQRLREFCERYTREAGRGLDSMTIRVLEMTMQYVHVLQHPPESQASRLSMDLERFHEAELLLEEQANTSHRHNLHYYYTCKLELNYLYGRYTEALTCIEKAKRVADNTVLSFNRRFEFFRALTLMKAETDHPYTDRRPDRATFPRILRRFKRWSRRMPESTTAKYWILLAEQARVDGRNEAAFKLYEKAKGWAQRAGCPEDEALASELSGQLYAAMGNHGVAQACLQQAAKAYLAWGARGKAISMRERYPLVDFAMDMELEVDDVYEEEEAAPLQPTLPNGLHQELDMDTLRQASQAGDGMRNINLLQSFLHLAIRASGAEKGVVLLGRRGQLAVEAEEDLNRQEETQDGDCYSAAVVQYVLRTQKPVLLSEAAQSIFATDPYVQRQQPRSILCLPLRYPEQREGALYLENNLTSDAFTPDRLEVLEMVFSRMAYIKLCEMQNEAEEAAPPVKVQLAPSLIESLSNREVEILRLMAGGLSNREIGQELEITEGTVKSHVFNIFGKLQVNKRVQAITKARELQLLM